MKAIYFAGMKFGDYTLVSKATTRTSGWTARCKCGTEIIYNPAIKDFKNPQCSHAEAMAGKKFGDFDIATPAVITKVVMNDVNHHMVEGVCRGCEWKKAILPSAWKTNNRCPRCRKKDRHEFEDDQYISSHKARKVRGITRQRIFQVIDAGILDAVHPNGRVTLIVKNDKWKAWSAITREEAMSGKMKKWPERIMKYDVGQVHGCWTITNRVGQKWECTCTCGKVSCRSKPPMPTSTCCHIEQIKAGAKFGNLTVCTPLRIKKRIVRVECGCGYKWMANASFVTLERYRRFFRCKSCKNLWESS